MLTQLTIKDFAIIDSVDVTLDDGMTVLTGETGAGKSILIDALGLASHSTLELNTLGDVASRKDYQAALVNFRYMANAVWTTQETVDHITQSLTSR